MPPLFGALGGAVLAAGAIAACSLDEAGVGAGASSGPVDGSPPVDVGPPDAGGSDAPLDSLADADVADAAPFVAPSCDAVEAGADAGACALVSGVSGLRAITSDAIRLYWAEETTGNLKAIPIAGGAPVLLYATNTMPRAIALDPAAIYWTDQNGINRIALAGGAPIKTVVPPPSASALVVSTIPFFATPSSGSGTIESYSTDLVATHQIHALAQNLPQALAVDADQIYWVTTDDGSVRRTPRTATQPPTNPEVVVGGESNPQSIAVDASFVYFTTGSEVKRAPKGAAQTSVSLSSGEGNPQSIAVDASGVYWVNVATGELRTVALSAGNPSGSPRTLLVAPQTSAHVYEQLVTLDARYAYLAVTGTGQIVRVPR